MPFVFPEIFIERRKRRHGYFESSRINVEC
jgi:hypothetical protein